MGRFQTSVANWQFLLRFRCVSADGPACIHVHTGMGSVGFGRAEGGDVAADVMSGWMGTMACVGVLQ